MAKGIIFGIFGVFVAFMVRYVYQTSADDDIFIRLVITVFAGLYVGLVFLVFVLPAISDGIAKMMYSDPGGVAEDDDPMREARSLQAKGDFVGAIESLRAVVNDDPANRLAWAEIAKIQLTKIEDPEGALAVLTEGLEGREWEVDDAAYFLFRISEVHIENLGNRDAAIEVLKQVCELFPETKHSANATHQLRELGAI